MVKISHFEVYTDRGRGWQLENRFDEESRYEAFNLAKELEQSKVTVKIIKEIYDVLDNSYQETVEYVSNLNGKKDKNSILGFQNFLKDEDEEEIVQEANKNNSGQASQIFIALFRFVVLIFLCLAVTNFLTTLIYPIVENFITFEDSRTATFIIFFAIFMLIAIPVILKHVPWYVFTSRSSASKKIFRKDFYEKTENLLDLYNLNDDVDPIVTPVYPEASTEFKQYIISFLSDVIGKIKSDIVLKSSFSKFGVKLIVYGGCLEVAKHSRLNIAEANSILFEALKLVDGDDADLESFYEAKRTYKDNKVAVFLTGLGAYLMGHVIKGSPMPTELLNLGFAKWEEQNKVDDVEPTPPETEEPQTTDEQDPEPKPQEEEDEGNGGLKAILVSVKSDLKFLDSSIPNQEQIATETSGRIREILSGLIDQYRGMDVIEAEGITTIKFKKLSLGMIFAKTAVQEIRSFQDDTNNDNLILRNCCAIAKYDSELEPNLNDFWSDIFEHIYNNEIVLTKDVYDALQDAGYHFEYLGEKKFNKLDINVELYKLIDDDVVK